MRKRALLIWVSLLLVFVLVSVLASCGSTESSSSADQTSAPDGSVESSAKDSSTTPNTSDTPTTDNNGGDMTTKLTVSDLTVNMTDTALGIDSTPYFGWTVSGNKNNDAQSAYQIKVYASKASCEADKDAVWDSGKVESKNSTSVTYQGSALKSASTYYWKVTVWNKDGSSVTATPREFRTGMFSQADWKGDWIGAASNAIEYNMNGASWIWYSGSNNGTSANGGLAAGTVYFRGTFTPNAAKTVSKAVFVFTADDYGTLYVNGKTLLAIPNQTDIWKTGNIVDISSALVSGENLIAASITNSSQGYAGFVGKLFISYTDGTTEYFSTSKTWKASKTASTGWNTLSFDAASWVAPDQYVSYGGAPWSNQCVISNKGDRAAVLLRKEFTVGKDIAEATAYMSGIGYSILSINGTLADDCFLDPCNTQYNKTVLYRAFDVTKLVKKGDNAIGVELGNGFFKEEGGVWNWGGAEWKADPMLRFYMVITYTDGTTETVVSDTTWKATSDGPITFNSIYYGEFYDARLEKNGWTTAAYDDAAWKNAVKVKAPSGVLECQLQEPARRQETFKPTQIKKLPDGSYVVYCPEMVAGWIALTIDGARAGDTITITYSEKLNADGSVQKLGGGDGVNGHWWPETYIMTDKYTAKGGDKVVYEPRHSYKGFQYIQIWNYPGELTADDIVIYRIRNAVETTGTFTSSNELLNKMHQMMLTTVLNNLQGKPTDCPVWEKNGWLGDFNVAALSIMYNYDMRLMTENFVEIMEDCFEQYGLVPPMVPTAGWNIGENYVWNTVYVLSVAEMYRQYGSLDYVAEQYETMKLYAKKTSLKLGQNGWVCPDGQLGDWVAPMGRNQNAQYVESPSEGSGIVGTAMLYLMYDELCDMAKLLGKPEDVKTYEGYMSKIYDAFNKKFYVAQGGYYQTTTWTQYGTRTKFRQTSQLLPLAVGLVPDAYKGKVINALIKDINAKNQHLDTGCVGSKFILPVLTDLGYGELAYTIATQTTYPSWGFMIKQGSTSLWEMWETTSRSLDHFFLGTYEEWFYSHLAGVTDIQNGYETFTVRPYVLGDLNEVTCKIKTVRGELESSWEKAKDGSVTMTVTVPFGATATVIPPLSSVTVNGETVTAGEISLGSGTYTIICK